MSIEAPPTVVQDLVRPALVTFVRRVLAAPWPSDTIVTSWYRSPRHNASVGGNPFSQHLAGLAVDLVSSDPGGLVVAARSVGLVPDDEGDHVHVQLVRAGVLRDWILSQPAEVSAVFGHPVVRV